MVNSAQEGVVSGTPTNYSSPIIYGERQVPFFPLIFYLSSKWNEDQISDKRPPYTVITYLYLLKLASERNNL